MKKYCCFVRAFVDCPISISAEGFDVIASDAAKAAKIGDRHHGRGGLNSISFCVRGTDRDGKVVDFDEVDEYFEEIYDYSENFIMTILCTAAEIARERKDLSPKEVAWAVYDALDKEVMKSLQNDDVSSSTESRRNAT